MRKYRLVAKKGEGTFSEVIKSQNVKDGRYHAIKCMKNRFESIDQVNNLREIQALRRLSPHDHIVSLEEVLYDQPTGRLALVFELMDANLYELIRGMVTLPLTLSPTLLCPLLRSKTIFESPVGEDVHVAAHESIGSHAP
jgi:renal tumor antigen